jgi:hypothetical protein
MEWARMLAYVTGTVDQAAPTQDGQLVSQSNEFELQREATTKPEREQGTEDGQKRDHANDAKAPAQ